MDDLKINIQKFDVEKFKKYVETYDGGNNYNTYSADTILHDMLYGIALAIDGEKFELHSGYAEFKRRLVLYLSQKNEAFGASLRYFINADDARTPKIILSEYQIKILTRLEIAFPKLKLEIGRGNRLLVDGKVISGFCIEDIRDRKDYDGDVRTYAYEIKRHLENNKNQNTVLEENVSDAFKETSVKINEQVITIANTITRYDRINKDELLEALTLINKWIQEHDDKTHK